MLTHRLKSFLSFTSHKGTGWQPYITQLNRFFLNRTFVSLSSFHFSTMACPEYNLSTAFTATLTTVCCISGSLAVVQNLAVLLAVRNIHSLRSTARYFMASLAAAELLSGFTGNLHFILNHSRKLDIIFMRTEAALFLFTTASVTFSLSNVALDRYIAITSPLQYHNRMTSTRCLTLIILLWFLALFDASMAYVVPVKYLIQMWIFGSVISLLIPFCIIAFCYFKICQASRSTSPIRESITEAQHVAENKRHRKTANTFGIITGLFIFVFMPSFVQDCIMVTNPPDLNDPRCDNSTRIAWICVNVISYFSAVFDPWVYAIRMRDFRMAVKELLQSMCRILPASPI